MILPWQFDVLCNLPRPFGEINALFGNRRRGPISRALRVLHTGNVIKGEMPTLRTPRPEFPLRNHHAASPLGWHELLAGDREKAFVFYGEFLGWQRVDTELGPSDMYLPFSAGGQTIGGMFTKRPEEPVPFWLYYFNIGDIDAAADRVKTGGGRIFEGPHQLLDGSWIARCTDPQGAFFALQGKRSQDGIGRAPASEVGWSTEWSGISSRGRLVTKPRG